MAVSVRSRKFCCCLPVRFGVFILSLVAMVGGSFVAAIGWIQISQLNRNPLDKEDTIALWIHSAMFTILAVLAVLGFVGAMIKNRAMISGFAIALAIHLGFSVASGIYTLVSLFRDNSQQAIDNCLNDSAAGTTRETCQNGIAIMKGIMVAIYVVTWLIQLYAYFVIERYSDQLEDEEMAQNTVVFPRSLPESAAPQMTTTYSSFAPPYPFTTPRQAYGVTRGQDPSNNV
ncbi:hypothetical protein BDZ97DRAFT_1841994 [Flammula alnicola]|nr:hypothetical protein BDZ97DRAFT_1841994 [Flammula alnicola]